MGPACSDVAKPSCSSAPPFPSWVLCVGVGLCGRVCMRVCTHVCNTLWAQRVSKEQNVSDVGGMPEVLSCPKQFLICGQEHHHLQLSFLRVSWSHGHWHLVKKFYYFT